MLYNIRIHEYVIPIDKECIYLTIDKHIPRRCTKHRQLCIMEIESIILMSALNLQATGSTFSNTEDTGQAYFRNMRSSIKWMKQ